MVHPSFTGRFSMFRAVALCLLVSCFAFAKGPQPAQTTPRLVRFSGTVTDATGKARTGNVSLTFAIYSAQTGGAPLWLETQNADLDSSGHYQVLLGATKADGLPAALFNNGDARWLGVQVQIPGEAEQARILLVSVPYAMKAGDADTLGGLPASSYQLATQGKQRQLGPEVDAQIQNGTPSNGTVNHVAKFDSAATIVDSIIFDNGTAVGIGTSTPAAGVLLDINGDIQAHNVMYNSTDNLFDRGIQSIDCGDGTGAHSYHVTGTFTTFGGSGFDGFRGATSYPCGNAMEGVATSTTGNSFGVYGQNYSNIGSGVVGESNDTTGTGISYGVQGLIDGPKGIAVLGMENDGGVFPPAAAGDVVAIKGLVNNANSIASVFDNTAGGKIFSGQQNGVENISISSNGNLLTGGTVTAATFSGSGAGLTNIPGSVITGGISGTATSLAANGSNCAAGAYPAGVDAAGNAEGCSTSGSQFTGLNATQLSSGTVPDARISGTYSSALAFSNITNSYVGASAAITAAGVGSAITGTNTGTAANSNGISGTAQATSFPAAGVLGIGATAQSVGGIFRNSVGGTALAVLDTSGIPVFTVSSAGAIGGSGQNISSLNANNLFFGTVPSARVSGTYSNALTLSNASNAFTGNGSGLTALNATQLTTGTVPSAQLSGTYSSALTFNNTANAYVGASSTITGPVTAGAQLDQGAANRWAGTVSITADVTGSLTFATSYAAAPVCTVTPTSDPGSGVRYWVTSSPAAITVNTSSTATLTFNYICVGNPN